MSKSIIVYGSLLSNGELSKVFSDFVTISIKVKGYQRSFNQSSTWRDGPDGERGVLTAFPREETWINARLVKNVSESDFESYCDREEGYVVQSVSSNVIIPYDESDSLPDNCYIAVGQLWLDECEPVPSYKELCFSAAETVGDKFFIDFVKTTAYSVSKPDTSIDLEAGFEKDKFEKL